MPVPADRELAELCVQQVRRDILHAPRGGDRLDLPLSGCQRAKKFHKKRVHLGKKVRYQKGS
jgi:hypothetical protein